MHIHGNTSRKHTWDYGLRKVCRYTIYLSRVLWSEKRSAAVQVREYCGVVVKCGAKFRVRLTGALYTLHVKSCFFGMHNTCIGRMGIEGGCLSAYSLFFLYLLFDFSYGYGVILGSRSPCNCIAYVAISMAWFSRPVYFLLPRSWLHFLGCTYLSLECSNICVGV